jgi:hypothetical protein
MMWLSMDNSLSILLRRYAGKSALLAFLFLLGVLALLTVQISG